jgi:hypothetical protein
MLFYFAVQNPTSARCRTDTLLTVGKLISSFQKRSLGLHRSIKKNDAERRVD